MTTLWLLALAPEPSTWPADGAATGLRGIVSIAIVLGLIFVFAWLLRRGVFTLPGARGRGPVTVEAAVPLGDRRSLMIVSVEGRRLLLGLTPAQVSLVTELKVPDPGFGQALDSRLGSPPRSAS